MNPTQQCDGERNKNFSISPEITGTNVLTHNYFNKKLKNNTRLIYSLIYLNIAVIILLITCILLDVVKMSELNRIEYMIDLIINK